MLSNELFFHWNLLILRILPVRNLLLLYKIEKRLPSGSLLRYYTATILKEKRIVENWILGGLHERVLHIFAAGNEASF